jgi:hypothetical protein
MLVINTMMDKASLRGNKVISLIHRIKRILFHFDKISFYHIKMEFNGEVEHQYKVASSLGPSSLIKNGVIRLSSIP